MKSNYLITGRVPGDDEDCAFAFNGMTEDEACEGFAREMLEGKADEYIEWLKKYYDTESGVYITTIARSDSPIELV